MDTEKATYDPDLPHAWMRGPDQRQCALCDRPGKDELHMMLSVERAAARDTSRLVTQKGS